MFETMTEYGYCYDGSSEWSVGPKADPQVDPLCTVWGRDDEKAKAKVDLIVSSVNLRGEMAQLLIDIKSILEIHESNFDVGMVKKIDALLRRVEGGRP